jgi:uncharacterized protein (DUF885 family)
MSVSGFTCSSSAMLAAFVWPDGGNFVAEDIEAQARELADRFWDQLLELEPLLATQVGDERFDDRLPDPSEAGLARREAIHRAALEDAASFDPAALSVDARATLAILKAVAKREASAIEHRLDRFYAVTHFWGPSNLLAELGSIQRADTPERADRYLGRLRALPGYLEAIGQVATDAAKAGQVSPKLVVDRTIATVERLLATDPKDSPAITPVPEGSTQVCDRVVAVLSDQVWPAYQAYLETLRSYRERASETIGLCDLPGGEGMYASQILAWTTLALDAQEVHDLGRADLARIQEEGGEVAGRLGHPDPEEALTEFLGTGRDTPNSREEIVRLVEDQVRSSWEAAPAFFGRLPQQNCRVQQVEEFREEDMPLAFYQPPNADNSRAGLYYVNTSHPSDRRLHQLAAVTYHEANPGHHFQISIEFERGERSPLRRFGGLLAGSAFPEGWGLYSERLADEMGLYRDDYERLGMLAAQAWRAARLVVDTGIHALGWTRDQAVAQVRAAGLTETDALVETDRYIALPGQALAYKIGQIEIERWRAQAAEREGNDFSLRDFHDRLLELGSLPLPALRREMGDGGA